MPPVDEEELLAPARPLVHRERHRRLGAGHLVVFRHAFRIRHAVARKGAYHSAYLEAYEGSHLATTERVTVTLPMELVERIDRLERNCSRFMAEAAERELVRRRHEGLLRSLEHPHAEAADLADDGLADWGAGLPVEDDQLVDVAAGVPVRWVPGQGWTDQPR